MVSGNGCSYKRPYQSTQSMGKESHYNMEVTADQWNGANLRMAAWRCGWKAAR